MRNELTQVAGSEIDPIGLAHVCREVARQPPLEPIEVPFEPGAHATARGETTGTRVAPPPRRAPVWPPARPRRARAWSPGPSPHPPATRSPPPGAGRW